MKTASLFFTLILAGLGQADKAVQASTPPSKGEVIIEAVFNKNVRAKTIVYANGKAIRNNDLLAYLDQAQPKSAWLVIPQELSIEDTLTLQVDFAKAEVPVRTVLRNPYQQSVTEIIFSGPIQMSIPLPQR